MWFDLTWTQILSGKFRIMHAYACDLKWHEYRYCQVNSGLCMHMYVIWPDINRVTRTQESKQKQRQNAPINDDGYPPVVYFDLIWFARHRICESENISQPMWPKKSYGALCTDSQIMILPHTRLTHWKHAVWDWQTLRNAKDDIHVCNINLNYISNTKYAFPL